MKEKLSEPEKKIEEPVTVSATEKDEPAIQETSFRKYLHIDINLNCI